VLNVVADRLRACLEEHDLDAVVCVSPENVAYAAQFVVPSQTLMRWRHVAYVVTADGRDAMVCVDMEESTVRGIRPDLDLRVWAEFEGNAMTTLAELLRDYGLADKRVGIEFRYLSIDDHGTLTAALPDVDLREADDLLATVRHIKTSHETELLTRLSRISDGAIKTALAAVAEGDSEMDIAAALTRSVFEQGAQDFKLMIVATGERSQLPNVGPSQRALKAGDICRVEIFSVIDGYHAGVCRTASVGPPSPEAAAIYENLAECKRRVIEAIRPGVPARLVYQAFREQFDQLGMQAISFVGHSIGVDLHEAPYLGPHSDQLLEEGMVLGIEPLVYRTGNGYGMQIKDMVRVTATGCQVLSDVTDTDQLFVITSA
jgi:Xaa-Pro aminopeptidase